MPVEVSFERLSLPDKLQLMEDLWDNLTRKPGDFPSPDWHRDVLDEARRKVESGEEKFSDWELAREEIRKRIS